MSSQTKKRRPRVGALLLALLPVAGVAAAVVSVLIVIWPGHLRFWGYLDWVCPPPYNDPHVAMDTTGVRPGETVWSFSLSCLSENGGIYRASIMPLFVFEVVLLAVVVVTAAMVMGGAKDRQNRRRARLTGGSSSQGAEPVRVAGGAGGAGGAGAGGAGAGGAVSGGGGTGGTGWGTGSTASTDSAGTGDESPMRTGRSGRPRRTGRTRTGPDDIDDYLSRL